MFKSLFNPALRRIFSDPESYFKYSLNNLFDSFYNSFLDVSTDGQFDAVIVSGYRTNKNAGNGQDVIDATYVYENGKKYLSVTVVPKTIFGEILPDPTKFKNVNDITSIFRLFSTQFRARSEFSVEGGTPTLEYGQIVKCYFEEGSIQKSDFTGLRFVAPRDDTVLDRAYLDLYGGDVSGGVIEVFNTSTSLLLGELATESPQSLEDAGPPISLPDGDTNTSDNVILQDYQIPGAALPIALNIPGTRTTSILGRRVDPLNPSENASHSGIDIAQPTGSPLYAIFDGVVMQRRASPSSGPFVTDPVYGQVGAKGYGLVMVTKHDVVRQNGERVTIFCEYGHIHDMIAKRGQRISKGEAIATVGNRGGSTGPHLHLTVREKRPFTGNLIDPLASFGWFNKIPFKTEGLKNRWLADYPDLVSGIPSDQLESNPDAMIDEDGDGFDDREFPPESQV